MSRPEPSTDDDEWSEVWDGPVTVTGVQPHGAHLRACLLACGALLIPAGVVGAVLAGAPGAVAAPAGVGVVAAFFTVSTVAVAAADRRDPKLTLPVALGTYLAKVWFLGVVAFALTRTHAHWHAVFAGGLGAGIVTWLGAHVIWFLRTPPPRVEGHDSLGSPAATSVNRG